MWAIGDTKRLAKSNLRNYYWKAVIVTGIWAFIVMLSQLPSLTVYTAEGNSTFLEQMLLHDYYGAVFWNGISLRVFAFMLAAVIMLLQVFVCNPLLVGLARYFTKSQMQGSGAPGEEIWWAFHCGSYGNVVKIMFLRDLYTLLWTLLLIIPGIVKSLEYQMIPYILAENPDVDRRDAFALTKDMMNGSKFRIVLLQLSFIGWFFLGIIGASLFMQLFISAGVIALVAAAQLAGLIGTIFVLPYVNASVSEVYLHLRADIDGFPFGGFGLTEMMEDEAMEDEAAEDETAEDEAAEDTTEHGSN